MANSSFGAVKFSIYVLSACKSYHIICSWKCQCYIHYFITNCWLKYLAYLPCPCWPCPVPLLTLPCAPCDPAPAMTGPEETRVWLGRDPVLWNLPPQAVPASHNWLWWHLCIARKLIWNDLWYFYLENINSLWLAWSVHCTWGGLTKLSPGDSDIIMSNIKGDRRYFPHCIQMNFILIKHVTVQSVPILFDLDIKLLVLTDVLLGLVSAGLMEAVYYSFIFIDIDVLVQYQTSQGT